MVWREALWIVEIQLKHSTKNPGIRTDEITYAYKCNLVYENEVWKYTKCFL
jgi:hypothetical protein